MPIGRIHLLYGLAGSGKTTVARSLSAGGQGVRFTLDEWMLRLYPDLDFESRAYGVRADEVRDLIWSVAEQVVLTGSDVVLDWNSWSAGRRRWAVNHAAALGAPVILHKLSANVDTASQQARERTGRGDRYAHPVTRAGNHHLAALMEEPISDEGIEIREH
jgi:Predicted kinase